MMLHENQLKLLHHLARFNLMDYQDCLDMLDTEGVGDRTALSYVFRPLTKNKYLSKDENDCVSILAKGRALFPELTPQISTGGKYSDRHRVMKVSRMAALMEHNGIPVVADRQNSEVLYFIPSACWRRIASGILSTTRFTGMLVAGKQRLAVYDIGDGKWNGRQGQKGHCSTPSMAAMRQKPQEYSLFVRKMYEKKQRKISSVRRCGTVGNF